MKFFLCLILAITLVCCQPSVNPSTSNCAPTSTCVKDTGFCGNVSSTTSTYYCGKLGYFCDYKASYNCKLLGATGAACNYSLYYGLDCASYSCSSTANTCNAPPTAGPTSTTAFTTVYEGGACDSTSNFCHPSLDCVSSKCQRYFSVAASGTCSYQDDCQPGLVCLASGTCVAQTNSVVVGGACKADSDCGTQFTPLNCICNSPNANAGVCGSLLDPTIFSASAITNCAAFVNAYKNYATITSANANGAFNAYECALTCQQLNGQTSVAAAWQGYNKVVYPGYGYGDDCVYAAPTACATPTTTSANSKSSAATVFASALLIFVALFF